jgi:hypothetical protein
MTHTTTVILPWSHWEVYLLTFLWRRGAVFIIKEGPAILAEGVRLMILAYLGQTPEVPRTDLRAKHHS